MCVNLLRNFDQFSKMMHRKAVEMEVLITVSDMMFSHVQSHGFLVTGMSKLH